MKFRQMNSQKNKFQSTEVLPNEVLPNEFDETKLFHPSKSVHPDKKVSPKKEENKHNYWSINLAKTN